MLDAVSVQARQVAEELVPQIRLCAIENQMCASLLLKEHFVARAERILFLN